MSLNLQTSVPLINIPLVDPTTGMINEAWFLFLIQLFQRSGGDAASIPSQITVAAVLSVEETFTSPVAPQNSEILSLETIASQLINQGIRLEGEVTAPAVSVHIDPLSREISAPALSAHVDPLAMEVIAAPRQDANSISEMTFAPVYGTDSTRSPQVVTAGTSPWTYKASARQAMHITGGTVSALSLSRGSTTLAIDYLGTGQLIEMSPGDSVTVTYSVAPPVTILSR
jgi:hypothetical protein